MQFLNLNLVAGVQEGPLPKTRHTKKVAEAEKLDEGPSNDKKTAKAGTKAGKKGVLVSKRLRRHCTTPTFTTHILGMHYEHKHISTCRLVPHCLNQLFATISSGKERLPRSTVDFGIVQ